MSRAPLTLIVTADDFGIGLETSRGIVRAHLEGPVTCTSLMTLAGEHAARSIPLLEDAPRLEVGLHVVLSGSSRPLAATSRASGLVTRGGTFFPLPALLLRAVARRIDRRACFDEICAQADMFRKLTGRAPAYVDGHHHVHQLPVIRRALVEAVEKAILPAVTRVTTEPPAIRRHVRTALARRRVARWLGRGGDRRFRERGIARNDGFFGMLSDAAMAAPFPWHAYFNHLPESGSIEWVVHPGQADDTLIHRDEYVRQRPLELAALTNPANRSFWQRPGIVLDVKSSLSPHSR